MEVSANGVGNLAKEVRSLSGCQLTVVWWLAILTIYNILNKTRKERKSMAAKKTTILTADDDPQLLRLVARNLELEDYDVLTASDGKQALEQIEAHAPDLVLLDVMMPKMDGFTVCQRVREFSSVLIIIVTARGQDEDKVRGLDLGADDYLTKPFSVDELLARVRSVLRRAQFSAERAQSRQTSTSIGDLCIDYTQHRLLDQVWGAEYVGESHMLQVNVNRLRRKIEPDPSHPRYIMTRVGIGYFMP